MNDPATPTGTNETPPSPAALVGSASRRSAVLGAIFLMATSAIGPGFITQTTELPIGFGVLLWVVWRRRDLLGGYRYPASLLVVGVLAWLLTLYLGYSSLEALGDL